MYEYLTSHLAQVEAAIWTGGGWRQLADEGSLVDYLLGTEVTKNPDGYRGSVYAHKVGGAGRERWLGRFGAHARHASALARPSNQVPAPPCSAPPPTTTTTRIGRARW